MRASSEPYVRVAFTLSRFGPGSAIERVERSWDAPAAGTPSLDELLEGFQEFLQACGFVIEGQELTLVPRHPGPEDEE